MYPEISQFQWNRQLLGSFPFLFLFPLKASDSIFPIHHLSRANSTIASGSILGCNWLPNFPMESLTKRLLDRQTLLFLILTTSHSIIWICNQIKSPLPIRGEDDEGKKRERTPCSAMLCITLSQHVGGPVLSQSRSHG